MEPDRARIVLPQLSHSKTRHYSLYLLSAMKNTFIVMSIIEITPSIRMTPYPAVVLSSAHSA